MPPAKASSLEILWLGYHCASIYFAYDPVIVPSSKVDIVELINSHPYLILTRTVIRATMWIPRDKAKDRRSNPSEPLAHTGCQAAEVSANMHSFAYIVQLASNLHRIHNGSYDT